MVRPGTLGLIGALLYIVPAAGQETRVASSSPAEAKLVSIDRGTTVVPTSEIRYYGRLLDQLDGKCKEDRTFIGDIAVKSSQLLKEDKGVKLSIKRFLESMDQALAGEAASLGLSCAEVAAALVVMIDRP